MVLAELPRQFVADWQFTVEVAIEILVAVYAWAVAGVLYTSIGSVGLPWRINAGVVPVIVGRLNEAFEVKNATKPLADVFISIPPGNVGLPIWALTPVWPVALLNLTSELKVALENALSVADSSNMLPLTE
jgi:hypothetical protein